MRNPHTTLVTTATLGTVVTLVTIVSWGIPRMGNLVSSATTWGEFPVITSSPSQTGAKHHVPHEGQGLN
jgi:hypothetical protein